MAVSLKNMSRKDLLKLRDDVEKELTLVEERERKEALRAAEDAAAKFGFSLDDLSGGRKRKGKGARSKSAPKYRNPDNADQTWTGLGRKPQWFHDQVGKGVDPSKMEI